MNVASIVIENIDHSVIKKQSKWRKIRIGIVIRADEKTNAATVLFQDRMIQCYDFNALVIIHTEKK